MKLLHLNLFDLTQATNLGGKKYVFVVVDDYFRYTWSLFLTHKDESFKNLLNLNIVKIRTDNGTKYKYCDFSKFCDHISILHEF